MSEYSITSLAKRSVNNISAPVRVFCDKLYDYVMSDMQSVTSNDESENSKVNVDGPDTVLTPTKFARINASKNIFEEYIHFCSGPTKVYPINENNKNNKHTPCIYLGSAYNAACYYTLKEYNIKYIINVTEEISNYYEKSITYYRIAIRDDNCQSIKPFLQESYDTIKRFLAEKKGNILVHCYMGKSRSATVVANFISTETGENVTVVLNNLMAVRPIVNPTEKFASDLISHNAGIGTTE